MAFRAHSGEILELESSDVDKLTGRDLPSVHDPKGPHDPLTRRHELWQTYQCNVRPHCGSFDRLRTNSINARFRSW